MIPALRFDGVVKRFGRRVALDAISFEIPRGSLCAFVGPNGAGKTTAFGLVCGFQRPDAGAVEVLGGPFDPWRLKGHLAAMPQDADLGDRHSPRELLVHLARLQGVARAPFEAERVLDLVNLRGDADRRIASLSHGMRRRVAVATALVGDAEIVLLDEPTAGLDPVQARSLRDVLAARRDGRRTLVVSSHNLDELERLCDHVVMVDRGRCVASGLMAEVTRRGQLVEWVLGPGAVPVARLVEVLPESAFSLAGGVLTQRSAAGDDLDASTLVVMRVLADAGVSVRELRRGASLEQTFFEQR